MLSCRSVELDYFFSFLKAILSYPNILRKRLINNKDGSVYFEESDPYREAEKLRSLLRVASSEHRTYRV